MTIITVNTFQNTLQNRRLDADFYRGSLPKNEKLEYKLIGDKNVTTFAQYGLSIDMNEEGLGYKIYRMNEIEGMFCSIDVSKYANISKEEMEKFKLRNNDVIFNRTNSFEFVGRTGIFKEFSHEDFVFASYLVRVRTNADLVLPEYLTAFLNTKFGIYEVKRHARISINQSNVSASELKKILIPILPMSFQEEIREHFNNSFKTILEGKAIYEKAKKMLFKELEYDKLVLEKKLIYSDLFSRVVSSNRMDAEYHQKKYAQIVEHLKKLNGLPLKKLVVYGITSGSTPYSEDAYSDFDSGVRFIRATSMAGLQISKNDMVFITPQTHNRLLARSKINDFDVLFPIAGSVDITIGRCAVVPQDFGEANINQALAILRFDRKTINPYYAALFFSEGIGHESINLICRPSSQANINLTELGNTLLPKIDIDKQNEIGDLLVQSHTKLDEAKAGLFEITKKTEELIQP